MVPSMTSSRRTSWGSWTSGWDMVRSIDHPYSRLFPCSYHSPTFNYSSMYTLMTSSFLTDDQLQPSTSATCQTHVRPSTTAAQHPHVQPPASPAQQTPPPTVSWLSFVIYTTLHDTLLSLPFPTSLLMTLNANASSYSDSFSLTVSAETPANAIDWPDTGRGHTINPSLGGGPSGL